MMNTMKKMVAGTTLAAVLLAGGLFPAVSEAAHVSHHHGHKIHGTVHHHPGRIGHRPRPIPRPPRPYYCSYHGRWHRHRCDGGSDRIIAGILGILVGAAVAGR